MATTWSELLAGHGGVEPTIADAVLNRISQNAYRIECKGDSQLFVKQATVHGASYIVCRSEAEAEKDRADRQAMVANLEKQLSGGDKALVGNAGNLRYLRGTGTGKAFEIDAEKLTEEVRFDGIFVLGTNATMTPLNAVLRYRELLLVEDLFRRAKVQLRTRPIYHSCDAAIRGHVFCSIVPGARASGEAVEGAQDQLGRQRVAGLRVLVRAVHACPCST